jgi:hypothetical protein
LVSYTPAGAGAVVTDVQTELRKQSASDGTVYTPAGTGAVATTVQTKLRETVSVKDFGAIGDGVTDDTAAIQAALDSGAKEILCVEGEDYLITSTLNVPEKVFIFGYGSKFTAFSAITLLDFTSDGGVEGLEIDGGLAAGTYNANSIAIACSGTNNSPSAPTFTLAPLIVNCVIHNFGYAGIYFSYTSNGSIKGCYIYNIGYAGIGGVSTNELFVTQNRIQDITPGISADAYGVFLDRKDGISETADPRSYRATISDNIIKRVTSVSGSNGHAIDTHGGVGFVVNSNIINECQGGIYLTASAISGAQALGPKQCVVSNNTITSSLTVNYGILVYGARVGASVADYAEDCVVTGNVVQGFGSDTDATGTIGAIFVGATKNALISGNAVKDSGGISLLLEFQNNALNVSNNIFVDPFTSAFSAPSCIRVNGSYQSGYIGGNTFKFDDGTKNTYVAVRSITVDASLTNLDLDLGRSSFINIDATHLSAAFNTSTGVRYEGFASVSGEASVSVVATGVDGIVDITFAKRLPYIPTRISTDLQYPFNSGGVMPILGVNPSVLLSETGFRLYAKPSDGTTWTATGSITFQYTAS